jgi:hypothetical protein
MSTFVIAVPLWLIVIWFWIIADKLDALLDLTNRKS